MRRRDLFLTGTILLLLGILIGLLIAMFRPAGFGSDHAQLRVTEVLRSDRPNVERDELERMDSRFLFQRVAEVVTPSVVYIETTVQVRNMGVEDEDPDADIWERFMPRRARTVGSGVILSGDGYILTNNHVVESAVNSGIRVTLSDKRSYPARIVGTDPSTDLAVIRIDADRLHPALIGNSDEVTIGEWVLAVGNPFRLRSTVTAGIVSALSRDVQIINDAMRIESFIQTDAAINRGNSGGALVNTSGELIGINTAIATQSGNYQGYGFAVPSNLALKVAGDLIEFGELRRGMLGVSIESVNHSIARDLGLEGIHGVLVVNVMRDGAAFESGIRRNDVILEVNGAAVNEANQLQERVAMYRPGDRVELTVWRQGEINRMAVSLRELVRPEPSSTEGSDPGGSDAVPEEDLELQFEPGFSIREQLIETPHGTVSVLLFSRVEQGSRAWLRGLRAGIYLLEVEGIRVRRLDEAEILLNEALQEPGPVRLRVRSEDGSEAHYLID